MSKPILKPVTLRAPSAWASYLINGDASGLSGADKAQADAFVARVVKEHGSAHFCDASDAGFCTWHDAHPEVGLVSADCQDYTMLVDPRTAPTVRLSRP